MNRLSAGPQTRRDGTMSAESDPLLCSARTRCNKNGIPETPRQARGTIRSADRPITSGGDTVAPWRSSPTIPTSPSGRSGASSVTAPGSTRQSGGGST